MTVLIKNSQIVDWQSNNQADVLIEDGVITQIGENLPPTAERIIDATGLTLLPSFVDLHTHLREPGFTYKEDLESGCMAAVHGGYTTLHLMPNTNPVVSCKELVLQIENKAKQIGLCQVIQSASITKDFDGESVSHLPDLANTVTWFTDDGNGIPSTQTMLDVIFFAENKNIKLMLHEEDPALTPYDSYLSEELPTWRDCQLAKTTTVPFHFCHVSTKKAMDYIVEAKQSGANVSFEVTPHHLTLTSDNSGKVAPPLRTEENRLALIEGIRQGWVDAISTDHAPHSPEDKEKGANGFTGLDLSFATCYTTLVKNNDISLSRLSHLLSKRPAELLGIAGGTIAVGEPANLVLTDLNHKFVASEKDVFSKSKNSPLLGQTLYGQIKSTFWKGQIVYEYYG